MLWQADLAVSLSLLGLTFVLGSAWCFCLLRCQREASKATRLASDDNCTPALGDAREEAARDEGACSGDDATTQVGPASVGLEEASGPDVVPAAKRAGSLVAAVV